MKYLIPLLIVAACSSKQKVAEKTPETITNDDFKKERALKKNEVRDFYAIGGSTLSPALQDETLDNYSREELAKVNSDDPLVDISIRCNKKDFSGAYQVADKNFNKYQRIPSYWNLIANCHLNQGSERKALLFYNKSLELDKNYIPALNNIGVMYSRQGQDQKALVAFERASSLGKFSKTPRYNLAKLYLTYGLVESALPVFSGLLNESPKDVDILNAVASAYFLMSDYGRALQYYKEIPEDQWKNPEIGLNLALTFKKTGNAKEAEKVFSKVAKPQSKKMKNYYAVIESQLGVN